MTGELLPKGSNASLPETVRQVRITVGWAESEDAREIDASALLLTGEGRVRSDDDFVFYNQPSAADGAVQHLGRSVTGSGLEETVVIDLEALPDGVGSVAIAASLSEGTFGDLRGLQLQVLDDQQTPLFTFEIRDASTETAFHFGEVYRRSGVWKVRAVGQGWSSGLAGLAQDFGVTVDTGGDLDPGELPEHPSGPSDRGGDGASTASDSVDAGAGRDSADDGAVVITLPTAAPPPAPRRRSGRGVRTRKSTPVRTVKPAVRLADDETWQPARLFSVSGVGGAEEQEKRATSAFLATMLAVRPFGRGIGARLGAPAGLLETYLEVPFARGESRVIPDGLIRVARGDRIWTGLLEVKTGSGQLRSEQVEAYVEVARRQGYDAVITLSNEISPGAGEHPVGIDQRKLRKVALIHLSWAEVLHEAQMVLTHRGVEDPVQAWILSELVRYLQHPRSGASGFDDMGSAWVPVREAVAAGTLRPGDRKGPLVADAWARLVRHLCLQLTADLGVQVSQAVARRGTSDPTSRSRVVLDQLVADGRLSTALRIPGAAGNLVVDADLRTGRVLVSAEVSAPAEGTTHRRVTWLTRQLKDAPADLLVEASFVGSPQTTCEKLSDVRESPAVLAGDRGLEVSRFRLTASTPLGSKRSGVKGAFIPSVTGAVGSFYGAVLQPVRPWVAPAPKLPEESSATDEAGSPVALLVDDVG